VAKHKYYILSVGDLVSLKCFLSVLRVKYLRKEKPRKNLKNYKIRKRRQQISIMKIRMFKKNKSQLDRYKFIKESRRRLFKRYFFKVNFIFNFTEIYYLFRSAILLRKPFLGEIYYRSKKQLLVSSLLAKIYFLY